MPRGGTGLDGVGQRVGVVDGEVEGRVASRGGENEEFGDLEGGGGVGVGRCRHRRRRAEGGDGEEEAVGAHGGVCMYVCMYVLLLFYFVEKGGGLGEGRCNVGGRGLCMYMWSDGSEG